MLTNRALSISHPMMIRKSLTFRRKVILLQRRPSIVVRGLPALRLFSGSSSYPTSSFIDPENEWEDEISEAFDGGSAWREEGGGEGDSASSSCAQDENGQGLHGGREKAESSRCCRTGGGERGREGACTTTRSWQGTKARAGASKRCRKSSSSWSATSSCSPTHVCEERARSLPVLQGSHEAAAELLRVLLPAANLVGEGLSTRAGDLEGLEDCPPSTKSAIISPSVATPLALASRSKAPPEKIHIAFNPQPARLKLPSPRASLGGQSG